MCTSWTRKARTPSLVTAPHFSEQRWGLINISNAVLLSTMPQYGIVTWLMASTVAQVNFATDLRALCLNSNAVGCVAMTVLFFMSFNFNVMVTQNIASAFFPSKADEKAAAAKKN